MKDSTKNALLLEVGPLASDRKVGGTRSLGFKMEVDRIHGKWLVNYFMPEIPFKRLAPQAASQGGN